MQESPYRRPGIEKSDDPVKRIRLAWENAMRPYSLDPVESHKKLLQEMDRIGAKFVGYKMIPLTEHSSFVISANVTGRPEDTLSIGQTPEYPVSLEDERYYEYTAFFSKRYEMFFNLNRTKNRIYEKIGRLSNIIEEEGQVTDFKSLLKRLGNSFNKSNSQAFTELSKCFQEASARVDDFDNAGDMQNISIRLFRLETVPPEEFDKAKDEVILQGAEIKKELVSIEHAVDEMQSDLEALIEARKFKN